jgi:hypothetical protein
MTPFALGRGLRQLAAWIVVPGLVVTSVWIPLLRQNYVPGVKITQVMLDQARQVPTDSELDELARLRFIPRQWKDQRQLVLAAEQLLQGKTSLLGPAAIPIRMPFDARDLDAGNQEWQLQLASLAVPETLIDAYEATGREEFFFAARDNLLGWADCERSAWLPRGYLWNDHAVASRAAVLAHFWRLYRNRPDYNPEVARPILEFAARTGQWLAKPGNFTVTTNHGVMENLALWQLRLAFPYLPGSEENARLAFTRLNTQLSFYMDDEGVVLEHSSGYHAFGLHLMGLAFRYLSLLHKPVPDPWIERYECARKYYAQLKRPDGTLPIWGDTDGAPDAYTSAAMPADAYVQTMPFGRTLPEIPRAPASLYPVSGYSIWWDGLSSPTGLAAPSQTAVAWSYFPGLGHKHADEMSVLFWSGGQTWWTDVGYWAFGDEENRDTAVSWSGSDAPHLVGESGSSARETRLLSWGWSEPMAALDLQRKGPGNYAAERQVLRLAPDLWLVLDSTSGDTNSRTTTTWTSAYDAGIEDGKLRGSYVVHGANGAALAAYLLGSKEMTAREFRGSRTPFGGWEMFKGVPQPAPAIVTEQPANGSWAATLWSSPMDPAAVASYFAQSPAMSQWKDSHEWTITIPHSKRIVSIRRAGDTIFFGSDLSSGRAAKLVLQGAADVTEQRRAILRAHEEALRRYPKFAEFVKYRVKVTYLLLTVLVLQGIFAIIYRQRGGRHLLVLWVLAMSAWVASGIYIYAVYLQR